jgi:anti-sigma factor RsiW
MRPLRSWLRSVRARRRPHAAERLSALLDDELSVDEALEVTRHVVACDDCAAELEAVRRSREVLRALPRVDPPREVYAVGSPGGHTATAARPLRRVLTSVALAGLLFGTAAYVAGTSDEGTVAPSVDVYRVDHVARTESGPVISPVDLGR